MVSGAKGLRCPHHAQKRTFGLALSTSALCQKQTCYTSIMLIHHDEVALAKAPPSLWGDYAAGKVN
jgi:hypothetical protein